MSSPSRIAIIDSGMGNLRSVLNAFHAVGAHAAIIERPVLLADASHVVLPGVGAFGDGMRNLVEGGWVDALERYVRQDGKPFLGICLGMQLLATRGTEHGEHKGLGWVPGSVIRLPDQGGTLRIPHVGWNDVCVERNDGVYGKELASGGVFYFVHSFHLVPDDAALIDGRCPYGEPFAASVSFKNISAVQFHPEKSQRAGLEVLKHFVQRT